MESGGEVKFGTRIDELIFDKQEVIGAKSHTGDIFPGPVILATGHSARDVYYYLHRNNIELEAKGFAVGVRLEHPQELIDRIQYHNSEGRGKYLPAAEYSFVTQIEVFTRFACVPEVLSSRQQAVPINWLLTECPHQTGALDGQTREWS